METLSTVFGIAISLLELESIGDYDGSSCLGGN
jgi:hypothetical protein